MTAEIGILNREAVALAADSAVTSGAKIFPSANKIFMLSKFHPVGIMVYGNASFLETPWETVVKVFRKQLGDTAYPHLSDYLGHFLDFLRQESALSPPEAQLQHTLGSIADEFGFIRSRVDGFAEAMIGARGKVSDAVLKAFLERTVEVRFNAWKGAPLPPDLPNTVQRRIRKEYLSAVKNLKEHFFSGLMTSSSSVRLNEIAVHVATKMSPQRTGQAGVVIAGFGEKEIYPSLHEMAIQGMVEGHLKCEAKRTMSITSSGTTAAVLPFAQDEMVHLFMEGIDPEYRKVIDSFLHEVITSYPTAVADVLEESLGEKRTRTIVARLEREAKRLVTKYEQELAQNRRENYVNPIISVMAMLPKGELASAAETLVNLTSFKRRVSRQAETVGGPVDVAVISKGDGFVWIRRKHYFDPKFNHHFFSNYFPQQRSRDDEGEE